MRKLCIQVPAERGEGTRARRPDKGVGKGSKGGREEWKRERKGKEWESRTLHSKLMASAVRYCCRL